MGWLGWSLLGLWAGLALLWPMRRNAKALAFADGIFLAAIVALVVLDVVPGGLEHIGVLGLGLLALGFLFPRLLERVLLGWSSRETLRTELPRAAEWRASWVTAALIVLPLAAHGLLDGLALALPDSENGSGLGTALAAAVLVHQVPFGLALGATGRRGWKRAWLLAALLSAATILGYWAGLRVNSGLSKSWLATFSLLIGGWLLHVALSHRLTAGAPRPLWSALGVFAGAVPVAWVLLVTLAAPEALAFSRIFVALVVESAPALCLGVLAAGALHLFSPLAFSRWMRAPGRFRQAGRGVLFGLPLPVCSCGVLPLFGRLAGLGIPVTAALAFLIATPELGVDAFIISSHFLGFGFSLWRLFAAACCAVAVALVAGYFARDSASDPLDAVAPSLGPWRRRLGAATRHITIDMVRDTFPWIVVGLVIAAWVTPALEPAAFAAFPPPLQVPLLTLLGLPIYVCASGSAPMVAAFIAKGVSSGAALAFLLTGPATNISTFGIVAGLYGRKTALIATLTLWCSAAIFGYLTLAFDIQAVPVSALSHQHLEVAWWAWVAVALLAALLLQGLLRLGPRHLTDFATGHAHHDHDHDHDLGEAEGAAEPTGKDAAGHPAGEPVAHSCCH